ncbi:FeoA family protein [Gallaecimonas kandeliae]|uniref:FeoA family protein n=1 Tax=Gallaecimonas kandeliae TaxID=3029055 RepID=UPI002649F471|nr:FeoA family protein [Gallaecimonas kandeliae]WKE66509.1 FeoA family protein [Gallaecimonas kandeliae]
MNLADAKKGLQAFVLAVKDAYPDDPIARRLRELGFVDGEPVKVVARSFFGGNPLVVQVGATRFALRRNEAQRITLQLGAA